MSDIDFTDTAADPTWVDEGSLVRRGANELADAWPLYLFLLAVGFGCHAALMAWPSTGGLCGMATEQGFATKWWMFCQWYGY